MNYFSLFPECLDNIPPGIQTGAWYCRLLFPNYKDANLEKDGWVSNCSFLMNNCMGSFFWTRLFLFLYF
jgi:hypothetical protein